MHLSTTQFAEIVERLAGDAADRSFPGHDKRRAGRVAVRTQATIVPYVDGIAGPGVAVEVRDFSPRGIRFLHERALVSGEQFVLDLPQQTGRPVSLLCTVVHCRPAEAGRFSTGAEFTCVLRPGQPADAGGQGERARIRQSILD